MGIPRMSIVTDFYHITSFLCDIRPLLGSNAVSSFELTILEDELCLLDDFHLSDSLLNALSHLSNSCKSVRFACGPKQSLRPALRSHWAPIYTPKPGRLQVRKTLPSLTELSLSSPLFYHRSLKDSISFLLRHPKVTSFSVACSTASESEDVLSSMHLPALENLSIRVSDSTLAVLPHMFLSHCNLRSIFLSALFPWDEASFQPSGVRVTLPCLASASISSKYAGFNIVDPLALLDLHIYSFMAFPIPENRGYCEAVQSLVDIWLHSEAFRPVTDGFSASFTFPRRLSDHVDFCECVPIYRCSCTPATWSGRLVYGIRRIKIFLDKVTKSVAVRSSFCDSGSMTKKLFSYSFLNGFAISQMSETWLSLLSLFL